MAYGRVGRFSDVLQVSCQRKGSMVGWVVLAMSCKLVVKGRGLMVDGRVDIFGRVLHVSKGKH
jgi:hypothetical protein